MVVVFLGFAFEIDGRNRTKTGGRVKNHRAK